MVLEKEAEKLERLLRYIHEPESKKAVEELIQGFYEYAPVFQAIPPETIEEAVILISYLKMWERVKKVERRVCSQR
jgi:hypothetical protein